MRCCPRLTDLTILPTRSFHEFHYYTRTIPINRPTFYVATKVDKFDNPASEQSAMGLRFLFA